MCHRFLPLGPLFAASLLFASPAAPPPTPDCLALRLSGKYSVIAVAGQGLGLLNGSEDPRLRRVLEHYLQWATDEADTLLTQGADPKQLQPSPHLADAARRASAYARQHMKAPLADRLERLYHLLAPSPPRAPAAK